MPQGLTRLKWLVFALLVSPGLVKISQVFSDSSLANPVEFLIRGFGFWGLVFLLLTLSLSRLEVQLRYPFSRLGRLLGLGSFVYLSLHLFAYFIFDASLSLAELWRDIVQRPFILVGMLAWLLLVPLAITSTPGWQRRLKRHWKRLHRLVYPVIALGIWHYVMLLKADMSWPLLLILIFALLLYLPNKKSKTANS